MGDLYSQYLSSLDENSIFVNNIYLFLMKDIVKDITFAENNQSDSVLTKYVTMLLQYTKDSSLSIDSNKTNEFAQILGEAHFYLLCKEKNIYLDKINESDDKTPDFKHRDSDIYFEVKTLSLVDGSKGIKQDLEASLDAKVLLDEQYRKGNVFTSAMSVFQPYGLKPYQQENGSISTVINTLIEKTKQNYKFGQFSNVNTFMVINLSILPPFRTDNNVLRPYYGDDILFNKSVSGELWMMAFAHPGMLVLGIPEYERKPCVECILGKSGILADDNYKNISGLLFMIHPLRREPEIWGLYRQEDYIHWNDNAPHIVNTLTALTSKNWNDSKDSNSWQLKYFISDKKDVFN